MSPIAVLLHGLGGSPAVWDRLRPLLETSRTLAPRLTSTRTIEADADHVAGMLTDGGRDDLGSHVVVGHSRGGLVATALAERHPDLVARLVLVNTPPTTESRLTARAGGERILAVPILGRLAWLAMTPGVAARGLQTAFAPGTEVPDPFVADLRRTGRSAFVAASGSIDTYLDETPLLARLARLEVPVDVVLGSLDQRVDLAPYEAADATARVAVHTIPGAGHTPAWETPTEVAPIIDQALTETVEEAGR